MRIFLAAILVLFVSACASLNPALSSTKHLRDNQHQVLITDATVRSVFFLPSAATSTIAPGAPAPTTPWGRYTICAEPPPDAATELASKLSASGEGGRIGQGASADVALEYKTSIVQLAGRTQTVLLARDLLFNACLLRANGALSNDEVFDI